MRAVRTIGNIFIVLGLTLLLFVGYEEIGTSIITNHRQTVLAQFFDPSIDRPAGTPSITPTTKPSANPVKYKGPKIGRAHV